MPDRGNCKIIVMDLSNTFRNIAHKYFRKALVVADLVVREKEGRQFLYSPAKKNSSPLKIFERMKTSLFGNEKLLPILGLLESDDGLSREELEELKKVVDARAALALSILSLLSPEIEPTISQQFLKFIKDIQK